MAAAHILTLCRRRARLLIRMARNLMGGGAGRGQGGSGNSNSSNSNNGNNNGGGGSSGADMFS